MAKKKPTAAQLKVMELQRSLGVTPDGIMGPKTRAAAAARGVALPGGVAAKAVSADSEEKAAIKVLQKELGVKADGIMGPKTKAAAAARGVPIPGAAPVSGASTFAIKSLQKQLGLKADGIVGPKTKAAVAKKHAELVAAARPPEPQAIVQAVQALPPAASVVAADQLRAFSAAPGASADDYTSLVAGLSSSITPQLAAISDALATRTVSNEATSQSNSLLTEADRWADTARVQAKILEAIQGLAVQVVAREKLARRLYAAYGINLS